MFEGGGSSHAKGALQLSDQLPGVQSVTQVDKPRGTVDHWNTSRDQNEWYLRIIFFWFPAYLWKTASRHSSEHTWLPPKTQNPKNRSKWVCFGGADQPIRCVMLAYLWGAELGAGCRAGRELGEGSCHSAEAAGRPPGCTVPGSNPIWRRHTAPCVWKPERKQKHHHHHHHHLIWIKARTQSCGWSFTLMSSFVTYEAGQQSLRPNGAV